jgi:hypothetical protein
MPGTGEEFRALRFRCAVTGRRFVVVFSRLSQIARFQVKEVLDEKDDRTLRRGTTRPPGNVEIDKLLRRPAWSPDRPLCQGLLTPYPDPPRLGGPSRSHNRVAVEHEPPGRRQPHHKAGMRSFDIKDFDFAGWYCPCCGYGKGQIVHSRFVHCGTCGEYVCGGKIRQMPNGTYHFSCHSRCRGGGVLGQGTMTSLSGLNVDARGPDLLAGKRDQLPPPRAALPPSRDKDKRKDR